MSSRDGDELHFVSHPQQQLRCHDSHIANSLNNKIWESKFVDLSLLVRTACELHDYEAQEDIKVKDGCLCIVKSKSYTYLNTDKWASAFLNF